MLGATLPSCLLSVGELPFSSCIALPHSRQRGMAKGDWKEVAHAGLFCSCACLKRSWYSSAAKKNFEARSSRTASLIRSSACRTPLRNFRSEELSPGEEASHCNKSEEAAERCPFFHLSSASSIAALHAQSFNWRPLKCEQSRPLAFPESADSHDIKSLAALDAAPAALSSGYLSLHLCFHCPLDPPLPSELQHLPLPELGDKGRQPKNRRAESPASTAMMVQRDVS
eukprot:CAMPEP_0177715970 /NCGR_PEP_ID=MMETSP0484_2-20121128/14275_1 /TAXON_ID=354590 /ORGANISM="Rhodomonas lens, Strain RHODO" /LENGTH=226 /DNA_ID=CAMNT_0019227999 /DNA_START=64 /DNA_END=745 /DNA_ORIENTATION=+